MEGACTAPAHTGHSCKRARHASCESIRHTTRAASPRRRSSTPIQEVFEANLVVEFAFLGVLEDLIGLGAFFELLAGGGIVFVLVGMIFQGCLPVMESISC